MALRRALQVGVIFALQPGAALLDQTGSGDLGTLPTKNIFEWLDTALPFLALHADRDRMERFKFSFCYIYLAITYSKQSLYKNMKGSLRGETQLLSGQKQWERPLNKHTEQKTIGTICSDYQRFPAVLFL